MKKRTKQHTRKQRALRRWLLVLALFSISYFLLPITFSPTQTIRAQESANAIARTSMVQWKKAGPRLFCLSKNEDVLLLTGHFLYPVYGWMDYGAFPLDLTKENGPVAAWFVSCSIQEKNWKHLMFFGIVRQEEAAAVRVRDALSWSEEERNYLPDDQVWTGEILTDRDGQRYFWFGQDVDFSTHLYFNSLELLDGDGQILYTYDLTEKYCGVAG